MSVLFSLLQWWWGGDPWGHVPHDFNCKVFWLSMASTSVVTREETNEALTGLPPRQWLSHVDLDLEALVHTCIMSWWWRWQWQIRFLQGSLWCGGSPSVGAGAMYFVSVRWILADLTRSMSWWWAMAATNKVLADLPRRQWLSLLVLDLEVFVSVV
jgi:hypothetical protein